MTDKALEAAARATCQSGGMDPDEIMTNDGPRWRYYLPGAQAAISAYLSALPGEAEVVELVEELREQAQRFPDPTTEMLTDAADALQAMQARVKELEEALGFYADPKNYKGEFVPGGHTDRGTFEMAHHVNIVRKDAGDKARTALTGGSNG